MAALWIVDDELWAVIEPLLPVKPAGTPGPAQMDSRLALQGILFVLITGIGWEDLPQELGFGSGRIPARDRLPHNITKCGWSTKRQMYGRAGFNSLRHQTSAGIYRN